MLVEREKVERVEGEEMLRSTVEIYCKLTKPKVRKILIKEKEKQRKDLKKNNKQSSR